MCKSISLEHAALVQSVLAQTANAKARIIEARGARACSSSVCGGEHHRACSSTGVYSGAKTCSSKRNSKACGALGVLAFVGGAIAAFATIKALKDHYTDTSCETNTSQKNDMSSNSRSALIFTSDGVWRKGQDGQRCGCGECGGRDEQRNADSADVASCNNADSCNAAPTTASITADQIAKRAGVNLLDCYQCGKCSAGCPMHEGMDLGPKQIMRKLQMGLVDEALHAKSPWICAQCMTCASRCPQNIDITELMRAVRMSAHDAGIIASKESDVFETQFIKGVYSCGKNSEPYLAAFYNLKSGHLMQDMFSAPKMLKKGLISPKREKVRDVSGVRKLIEKCLSASKAGGER